jgi:hypothetical protein
MKRSNFAYSRNETQVKEVPESDCRVVGGRAIFQRQAHNRMRYWLAAVRALTLSSDIHLHPG